MSASVAEKKHVKRRYRLTARPGFPCPSFAVKCQMFDAPKKAQRIRNDKNEMETVYRPRFRTIDIPTARRYFSSVEDEVGQVVLGAEHELDERELAFINKELERFVVVWEGRYRPPTNKPDKTGAGPDGRFKRGQVHSTKTSEGEIDYRYRSPTAQQVKNGIKLEEPVSNYISIVPVDEIERLRQQVGESSDSSLKEIARLKAELEEAKREIAEREEKALAEARADERDSLKTPEGQVTKAIQSHKKRRR